MPRKRKPKVNRRARGTGSIFPDHRRGGWRAKVPVGRDPSTRKLVYKHLRADTQEKLVALVADVLPAPAGTTLADWSKRWLKALDIREQSRANYESNLRKRILPSLGAMPVAGITPFHIEEAARQWGRKVGATTVRLTLATLSACLQAATRAELTHRNAAKVVKRPKAIPAPFDLFTAAELRLIIDRALLDHRHHPFAVCAAVGCRIGEALALEPGDYDPAAGKLSISRTIVRSRRGKKGTGPPKSDNGVRTIEVPPIIAPALSRAPETRSYDTAEGRWKLFLASLGLRHRGTHQMKHSVASLMVAKHVPIPKAAQYVGDSVAVFLSTYVHPVDYPVAETITGWLNEAKSGTQGGEKVARARAKRKKTKRKRPAPITTR